MKPKILFISLTPPYPLSSGGNIRVCNLLIALSEFCDVFLVSLYNEPYPFINEAKEHLEQYCHSVWFISNEFRKKIFTRHLITGLFARRGFDFWVHNPKLSEIIKQIMQAHTISVVWFEQTFTAHYIKDISHSNVLTIMGTQNIESDVSFQAIKSAKNPVIKIIRFIRWFGRLVYERKYIQLVDAIAAVSEKDAGYYRKLTNESKVTVIPNFINLRDYNISDEVNKEDAICFTGSLNYFPNDDAVIYFMEYIWPKVKKRCHSVKFYIVGKNPSDKIKSFSSDDVIVTGFVESTVPFIKKSKISVVPLRYGGGTRLKILESMTCGTPVVSTSLGCEGLDVTNHRDITIADSPNDFAQAVIELLGSQEMNKRFAEMGKKLVDDFYSLKANTIKLEKLIKERKT
jgi:glycosyltransferase involved in cell wall biosynthesis